MIAAAASSAAIGIACSAIYLMLLSNQYTAVDGALRCLAVYWQRPSYLGPNNHLLHPANVWLWSRLIGFLGVHPQDPLAFIRSAQAMNALSAGGAAAIVNLLAWRFTRSLKLAAIAAACFALSWATLKHATNSAEPMVALFISLIAAALVIEGLIRGRRGWLFVGGLALALALANYGTMFLIAPLLFLLCFVWPAGPSPAARPGAIAPVSSTAIRQAALRLLACAGGTLAGAIAIYGAAYHRLGIRGVRPMMQAFVRLPDDRFYGGFSVSKLANFPVALIGNLVAVLPRNFQGIGSLLFRHRDARSIAAIAAAGMLVAAALAMLGIAIVRRCDSRAARLIGAAIVGAALLDLFPLVYREPLYDKFWLQPFAMLAVTGALAASWMEAAAVRRFALAACLILALEALVNLPRAFADHRSPTPCMDEARAVAAAIGPEDRVVADFDPVSALWMAFYDRRPSRTLLIPASAPEASLAALARWNAQCARTGCRMFFIAALDHSREEWEPFLGRRVGLSFDSLEGFRQASRIVDRFGCEPSSLRLYEPAHHPPPIDPSP